MKPIAALLVFACLLAPCARAEELVIGFEDLDFYPYGKPSEEKIYVGYLRTLLEAFARDADHQLIFEVTPVKRLYMGLREGNVDLFVPDNPDWSRQYKQGVDVYYSDVIATAFDGFAVLPGREKETLGQDIVHIGAILGFTVEPLFDEAARELIVFDRASRFESLFKTLLLGRVDAVYCNLAAANNVLGTLGENPSTITWSETLPRFKSQFYISSTRQELIEELNAWLRSHASEVETLKAEYRISLESRDWGN